MAIIVCILVNLFVRHTDINYTFTLQGLMHASSLRDERAGKMKTNIIVVEDGQEDDMYPEEKNVIILYYK
jgi:hypothetical protein